MICLQLHTHHMYVADVGTSDIHLLKSLIPTLIPIPAKLKSLIKIHTPIPTSPILVLKSDSTLKKNATLH